MADGSLRVVDVFLRKAASASYEAERPVASPHLLSPRRQTVLRAALSHQPWRSFVAPRDALARAAFAGEEPGVATFLAAQVPLLPSDLIDVLAVAHVPLPLRLAWIAHYFGDLYGTASRWLRRENWRAGAHMHHSSPAPYSRARTNRR